MNFADFINSGIYVAVRPVSNTEYLLREWFYPRELNDDLHSTLIFSKNRFRVSSSCSEYRAYGSSFAHLNGLTCLILESQDLLYRHQELLKLGGTHTFENYIPHITLFNSEVDLSELVVPDFEIVLGNEFCETLKN